MQPHNLEHLGKMKYYSSIHHSRFQLMCLLYIRLRNRGFRVRHPQRIQNSSERRRILHPLLHLLHNPILPRVQGEGLCIWSNR